MEKAEHCTMCGLTEREFLEDPGAYVPMMVTCPWCATRDRARSGDDTDSTVPGGSMRLVSKGTAERIQNAKPKRPASARERKRQR
jgi:hypothetical protein